ncbi:MAG: D-lyxose/D-mannose family sugar isomerase [Eubacteriales bacterium]|jgi:D-lyxose ketol-isomerase|nr:D-lyxose/D-mannose family sugar isomerase [Clostridiales bacterium]
MKRSFINAEIQKFIELCDKFCFKLPPFAFFTPEEWKTKNHEYDEIRDNALGWDLTDFGSGDFMKVGLTLFTLRNGNMNNPNYQKPYAEKIMRVYENQVTPFHFHWNKMEDIINRGGGNLVIQLYKATDDDEFSTDDVEVQVDGRHYSIPAGGKVVLTPGESITLLPRQYHKFWAEPGAGVCLVGEVSKVNDDNTDNRFYEEVGRFPEIEEDEPARFVLCNEYHKL